MINFSDRLKEILKKRKMNQNELAKQVHTTPATISRYLANNRTPNIALLNNMASALNVTADYLLGLSDDLNPPEKKEPPLSEKAQLMYDGLKNIGIDPDKLTDEDYENMFLFIDRNRDFILRGSIELEKARSEKG